MFNGSRRSDDSEDEEEENSNEDIENEEESEEESEDEVDEKNHNKQTFIELLEQMEDDWTGNIDQDLDILKENFKKYTIGTEISKTKLFKEFESTLKKEMKTLDKQYRDDGIKKDEMDVKETAFDATFDTFESRFEDIMRETYRRNNIVEKEEEEISQEIE